MLPSPEASDLLLQTLRRCEGYGELGMWQQTWQELEDLPDEDRIRLPVLIWRVRTLVGLGFLRNAVGLGRSLMNTFPESTGVQVATIDALVALAQSDARMGDHKSARQSLQEVVHLDPARLPELLQQPELRDLL